MTLEDIGEGDDDALLCLTNLPACCRPNNMGNVLGNWFFPNGTRVPSGKWDFYRTRGQMVVRMHRRRGGVEGIFGPTGRQGPPGRRGPPGILGERGSKVCRKQATDFEVEIELSSSNLFREQSVLMVNKVPEEETVMQ